MKLLLLIAISFLLNHLQADPFSLPEKSFSVNVATGAWTESAIEGNTRRVWNGKEWKWQGKPVPSIHHFEEKKLVLVTPPGRAPLSYTYKEGKVRLRREGNDQFIFIHYDDKGRVKQLQAPLGKDKTPIAYSTFSYSEKQTSVIDALGNKKVYHWNSAREVTQIDSYNEEGLYKTESIVWENGKIKKQSLKDRYGKEIVSQKNEWSKGNLVKQTLTGDLTGRGKSVSYVQTFTYDSNNNIKKVLDQDGKDITPEIKPYVEDKTLLQYDSLGRVIMKTTPEGNSESYSWDLFDNLTSRTTTKDGKAVYFTYDTMNRLIRESEGFSFEYDLIGHQIKQIDPEGNETEFRYDAMGRKVMMIQPEVLDVEGKSIRPVTQWFYNEQDQVIETIDPDGWSTKTKYTARGQVCRVEHPDGRVEEQFYKLNGEKEGLVTPPSKEETEEPTEATTPPHTPTEDPCHTERVFNDRGQKVLQKSFTDFSGIRTVRTFDALARVEKVEKYDLLGQLFQVKEFRYTPGGLKAAEITDGHTIEWIWGPQERLDALYEDRGTPEEKRTYLFYNSEGKLEKFVKPSGLTLNYLYDKSGALIELFSSEGSVHYEFMWNEQGRLREARDYLSGNSTYRFYNEDGQLIREKLANGLEISWEKEALLLPDHSRIRYHRDAEQHLKSISREDKEGHVLYHHDYTHFDALGQLTHEEMILGLGEVAYGRDQEQRINSVTSPFRQEKIRYEGLQLTEINVDGESTYFEYDAQFRLKKKSDRKAWFDKDGNITHNEKHQFRYDALGRLLSVDGAYHYEYDAFNRRISRLDNDFETTYFMWDGMEEIGATDTDHQIKQLKLMGSHGVVAVEMDTVPYAAIKDSQGTIIELISSSNSSIKSPWTYQGKREDSESGLIYFGARYLDPYRGQFLTPDPKGFQDGTDVYQFARSNPYAYSDSWGHLSIMNSFSSLIKTGWHTLRQIHDQMVEWRGWFDDISGASAFYLKMEEIATFCLGESFLVTAGLNRQPLQTGVFGNGELNSLVRVTFNHGIINTRADLSDNLRQISGTHGGVNVHYVYRPTDGLGWDIIKCLFVKGGYMSAESKELLRIWKGLIEEMGGVGSGGKIVHYAHSAGGADTWNALKHLSKEEQSMLDIRTFGSAALIPDLGTYNIINYVCKRDGVTLFVDPFLWIDALFFEKGNTVFLGSFKGLPLIDHPLRNESYQQVIRALGQAFLSTYGG